MRCKRQFAVILLAALLLMGTACEKKSSAKKAKLPGPAQAPTLSQTLPEKIQPQELPPPPTTTAKAQEPEPKQPPKKKTRAKKTPPPPAQPSNASSGGSATPAAETTNTTTSAELRPPRPPEAAIVAIGPDVSSPEANRDRQSTNQLLDTTENEVKKLEGQSLSSQQQSVLTQIKAYISQSRKAITDGDYERASNLAKKAQLLAQELTKR